MWYTNICPAPNVFYENGKRGRENGIRACDGIGRHARFRCCHHREGFLAVLVPANQQSPLFPVAGEKIGDFIALPYNEIARLTKSTGRFRIYNCFHFYYIKNRNSCFYRRGSSDMLHLGFPLRVKTEGN